MKLVTMTKILADRFGIIKAIEMIKEAGFDGFDYSVTSENDWNKLFTPDWKDYVSSIKQTAEKVELPCLQMHTPCPKVPDFISVEDYLTLTVRALEAGAMIGCPIAVVHPANSFTAEQNVEQIYKKLTPVAERLGIKVVTENMYGWNKDHTKLVPEACGTAEDFLKHLDLLKSENFGACLDIGHAQMQHCQGAPYMIRAMRGRIDALHVHDNDLVWDTHVLPFTGKSDWEEITSALAQVNYQGAFTYEIHPFEGKFPDEMLPSCLRFMHDTGRYLIKRIEDKKLTAVTE